MRKNRENKAREKTKVGENKTEVVGEAKGGNEGDSEETNVHIALRMSPVVDH